MWYCVKGARPVLSTLVDSDSPTVFKIKPDDKYPGSGKLIYIQLSERGCYIFI